MRLPPMGPEGDNHSDSCKDFLLLMTHNEEGTHNIIQLPT